MHYLISTMPLRDRASIVGAVAYVVEGQGAPMAMFLDPDVTHG
jgi:hypothetical protein